MQKKEENGILITLAPPGSMNLAAFFFNTRVIYRLQSVAIYKKIFLKSLSAFSVNSTWNFIGQSPCAFEQMPVQPALYALPVNLRIPSQVPDSFLPLSVRPC